MTSPIKPAHDRKQESSDLGSGSRLPVLILPPSAYSSAPSRPDESDTPRLSDGPFRGEGADLWSRVRAHLPFGGRIDLAHAATIAIAVAFGLVLGSLGGAAFADLTSSDDADPVAALQESIRSLAVEVRALKGGGTVAEGDSVSSEITASIEPASPKGVHGWVLWRVKDGRALVHGDGGYYEVEAGSHIPGLGLVEQIAREDGRWVVTTANGRIVAPRG